jgi:hypothetical protein
MERGNIFPKKYDRPKWINNGNPAPRSKSPSFLYPDEPTFSARAAMIKKSMKLARDDKDKNLVSVVCPAIRQRALLVLSGKRKGSLNDFPRNFTKFYCYIEAITKMMLVRMICGWQQP